jgi:hypothetical protein
VRSHGQRLAVYRIGKEILVAELLSQLLRYHLLFSAPSLLYYFYVWHYFLRLWTRCNGLPRYFTGLDPDRFVGG